MVCFLTKISLEKNRFCYLANYSMININQYNYPIRKMNRLVFLQGACAKVRLNSDGFSDKVFEAITMSILPF